MNRDERLALADSVVARIIHDARKVYEDHEGDGAWLAMERAYFDLISAALRQSSERDAVVEALRAVAEFMRKDVQSGDCDLWTPEYEALHDQVIVALKGAKP